MAALHHGVEPILGREHVFDIAGMKTDSSDPPLVRNSLGGKLIEVDSLMGTVKVACSDVNHTPLKGRSVVGWHVDALRMQGQRGVTERKAGGAVPGDKA
ncbi:hypothetical protein JMUB5695_01167 [Mycobacterium heckeshornense]|nr:hypothetical protein JMUB5695_01167 [Mycobacterium heckeshornense]